MLLPALSPILAAPSWVGWYLSLSAVAAVLLFPRRRRVPGLVRGAGLAQVLVAAGAVLLNPVLSPVLSRLAVATASLTLVLLACDELLAQLPTMATFVGSFRRRA